MHYSSRSKNLRRRASGRRKTKRGGSGIFFERGNEQDFLHFAENATYKKLSNGSFGVTTLATLRPNVQSPYQFLDTSKFGQRVGQLVIKFCLLGKDQKVFQVSTKDSNGNPVEEHLTAVLPYRFLEEINVQTEIFQKTMKYGAPLCPAVVFAGIFDRSNLLLKEVADQQPDNHYLQTMKNAVYSPDTAAVPPREYGVIAMELAEGYQLWHDFALNAPDDLKRGADPDVYATLLRLARETGYSHGDFHGGNIMVKVDKDDPRGFLVTVLDYGLAMKMSPQQRKEFNEAFDQGDYLYALGFFCHDMVRKDGYDLTLSDSYIDVCDPKHRWPGEEPYPGDAQMEQSIQDALDMMTERESRNAAKAARDRNPWNPRPLLPLSNQFRNKVFSGVKLPEEDTSETSEHLLNKVVGRTREEFEQSIRSAMQEADLSVSKIPFIRAVMRAVLMMGEEPTMEVNQFDAYIRCYMVCEGVVFKGQSAPYKSIFDLPDQKVVGQCLYASCKDKRPLPSFLDSLSPRGLRALDQLSISEVERLLCNPNTYLKKNRVALANKFNERGGPAETSQEQYQFPFQNERFIPRNKPMTIAPLTRKREADSGEMMEMMKRKRGAGRTRRRRAIRR